MGNLLELEQDTVYWIGGLISNKLPRSIPINFPIDPEGTAIKDKASGLPIWFLPTGWSSVQAVVPGFVPKIATEQYWVVPDAVVRRMCKDIKQSDFKTLTANMQSFTLRKGHYLGAGGDAIWLGEVETESPKVPIPNVEF